MKWRSWDVTIPSLEGFESVVVVKGEEEMGEGEVEGWGFPLLSTSSESEVEAEEDEEEEEGWSSSHCWKMVWSSCSVLKSRMPWPRSLIPGFRIHHSRSLALLPWFRANASWSSYASRSASSRNSA